MSRTKIIYLLTPLQILSLSNIIPAVGGLKTFHKEINRNLKIIVWYFFITLKIQI